MPMRAKIPEAAKTDKLFSFFEELTPAQIENLARISVPLQNTFSQEAAVLWLMGSEPFLGGARPIDVLLLKGPDPVIQALEAIAQGAYA